MTNYEKIYEIASDNYGLITSAQAKVAGISDKEMCVITKRGRMDRIGHGVYKIRDYIPVKNDPFAEAVALVGADSFLFGESVLDMLELMPYNPNYIYVATPKRVRRQLPRNIKLVNVLLPMNVTTYDGIPAQRVHDAVLSCIKRVETYRLAGAVREARKQGFITTQEQRKLTREINKCKLQILKTET